MNDIECPYCGEELEINHDDGYGYTEDRRHQQECGACGKTFTYLTSISFNYEAEKADCLNEGGEHDWKPTHSFPKCATKMACSICDGEREPTVEEKVNHGIPSYEEYFAELHKLPDTPKGGE